jgi:hypothetical protein
MQEHMKIVVKSQFLSLRSILGSFQFKQAIEMHSKKFFRTFCFNFHSKFPSN